jgi:glycolate oxidase iron-sulfur subunit
LPSIDTRLQALADECVMCGLCLPHCPTFRLSGLEQHSPRGRIALVKTLDRASIDHSIRESLESCLQCRACERICPAQVRYGEIIEGARAQLRRSEPATRTLAEHAARHPQIAASALSLAGRIARIWPQVTRQLGRRARWLLRAGSAVRSRPPGPAATVLFSGCLARSFDSEAQRALLGIARASGLDLRPLPAQACCGAIARHMGASADAEALVQVNQTQLAAGGTRNVVALDSGCIDALRRAAGSGIDVVEACRWLLDRQPTWSDRLRRKPLRVGLFAPCSHRHVVGDAAAARRLLLALPGVEVVPISEGLGCCGAAGPHLLAHPAQADALAQPIIEALLGAKLEAVATTNIGCALHLGERLTLRGITLLVRHPVAFLADRLPPVQA